MKDPVKVSKDVYEGLVCILQASRFSGICPLRVVRKANSFSFVSSRRMLAYSYVSVTLLLCTSIYGLVQNYKVREIRNIRLKTAAGLVCALSENTCLLVSCLLGTLLAPFFQHYFWRYLECLYQVDILLGTKNLNQRRKSSLVMAVSLAITFAILSIDIVLWSIIATKRIPLAVYLMNSLPYYLTYVCQMIAQLHFWMLVQLVKVRLLSLNEDLTALAQEIEICKSFVENNEYMDRKLVKVIRHYDYLRGGKDTGKTLINGQKISSRVKGFINTHHQLAEASTAANSYFGINVVVLLFGCLVQLLITPYILYLQLKETKNKVFLPSQIMWLVCHVLRLVFIVEPCQACKQQVQSSITTACKLLRLERCEETKKQLKTLLFQLDRCRIQFTACNMIPIDRTLLTTVTGMVTTYLVILFQFQ